MKIIAAVDDRFGMFFKTRAGILGQGVAERRATFCPDMFSICTELHKINCV